MPQTEAEEHTAFHARAPIAPVMRRGLLQIWRSATPCNLLDAREQLLTTSGRAALALAFDQLDIIAGDEVLLPAYHCAAMSAPVRARGAQPIFYRLQPDLRIDVDDLESKVGARCRCIVIVHFFGFPQPLDTIRRLCDRTKIALIEDCAHGFYSTSEPPQIGRTGDFAIGSLMKFLPVFDGGCLVSFRRRFKPVQMRSHGTLFQLKALLHEIEYAAAWSDSRLLRMVAAGIQRVAALAKAARPQLGRQLAEASPGPALGSLEFEEKWVTARISLASRLVLRFAAHLRSSERRRAIYRRYLAALASVPGGKPLWTDLPEGVIPYVFPFLLTTPQTTFQALRRSGVPMYRWEDVAEEACTTARNYKTRLVQFPCHQALTDEEVADLLRTIERVLKSSQDINK